MVTLDWSGIYDALSRDREDFLAWHSLGDRLHRAARGMLGSLGHAVVEDAVAETCAEVYVSFETAYGPATFGGFCVGKLLNARKRALAHASHTQSLGDFDVGADPVDLAALTQCLDWLGTAHPTERRAVELRFYEECPAAAIGAQIGRDANYARQTVSRGVAHLRKCIRSKIGGSIG